jgi:hypothetical protein
MNFLRKILCLLGQHSFYQTIGGYDSDGLPYPSKDCHYCNYSEDLR